MPRERVNLSESEIREKIAEFRDWIRSQPSYPQNLGKKLSCFVIVFQTSKAKSFVLRDAQWHSSWQIMKSPGKSSTTEAIYSLKPVLLDDYAKVETIIWALFAP